MDILDVSDIPLPDEEVSSSIVDEIEGGTAFKFCFIGAGQGGGKIAHQFWQYGYRRVCAINTASADLDPLGREVPADAKYPTFPAKNKLKIGEHEGAGGSIEVGRVAALENREDIFNLMRTSFGDDFDYIFVTATAGGGTGAGSCAEIVKIASELAEKVECVDKDGKPRVGVMLALPKESDASDAYNSAVQVLEEIAELTPNIVSPLILIDNKRINKLYPGLPLGKFCSKANHSACSILHLLNVVSARESEYTSFDAADYETLLSSGIITYGAMPINKWDNRDDLSVAVRSNLTKNVLVDGVDLSTGKIAGCVLVSNKQVLDEELSQEYIDDSFSMLARMIKPGSPVRTGVYAGNNQNIVAYTIIGGLDKPVKKIQEMCKLAGIRDFDGA